MEGVLVLRDKVMSKIKSPKTLNINKAIEAQKVMNLLLVLERRESLINN